MRRPWRKWRGGWVGALSLAALLVQSSVAAFPGVFVGNHGSSGVAHAAHVVVMLNGPLTVVTVMVDYDGPLRPFALLMPVPSDVGLERVHSIKREFVSRLEQLSAPRFHAFYEQDPCDDAPTEQEWDVRYQAGDSGFLAPEFLPPPERHWTISNEISVPTKPVFKSSEGEFRFGLAVAREVREISALLRSRGYEAPLSTIEALARAIQQRGRLLIAEVNPQRAELLGDGGLQLGAIRYWTREPVTTIRATLGKLSSAGIQDLFVYVLHPSSRFQVANYENAILPTNIEIEPAGAERLGALYNALFDAQLKRKPDSVMTEYVWPTTGCGEPCPNAPLTLAELMSLGSDVMEAELVAQTARAPEPEVETDEERQLFEMQLQGKSAVGKVQALKQHKSDRRELARRRAMMVRQRYVLTRLHMRSDARTLSRDVELQPVEHLQGGIGLPNGPKGVLATGNGPSKTSHYQVRFTSLFTWPHQYECQSPVRWRWGRRWKALDTALRKVWLASDLPRQGRDPSQLALVQTLIPELGIAPRIAAATAAEVAPAAAPSRTRRPSLTTCAVSGSGLAGGSRLVPFGVALLACLARTRKRWTSQIRDLAPTAKCSLSSGRDGKWL